MIRSRIKRSLIALGIVSLMVRIQHRPVLAFPLLVVVRPNASSSSRTTPRGFYIDSTSTPRTMPTSSCLSLYWGSEDQEPIQGQDRFKSCIPYILPFLDMDPFSYYLCHRFSLFSNLHNVLVEPLVQYMIHLPWLSILLFLAFTLGSRSATYLARSVRFNSQQAALLDVGLILPLSLAQVFSQEINKTIPTGLAETCSNTVYFSFLFVLGYCIQNNLRGRKPNLIPWISDIAELMTGPF